jgi:hypothetical protein
MRFGTGFEKSGLKIDFFCFLQVEVLYMTKEKGVGKKKAIAAVMRRRGVLLYTLLKTERSMRAGVSGWESLMWKPWFRRRWACNQAGSGQGEI